MSSMQQVIESLNSGAPVPNVDPGRLQRAWALWSYTDRLEDVNSNEGGFQAALASVTSLDSVATTVAVYIRGLLLKHLVEKMRVDRRRVQSSLFCAAAVFPLTGTELSDSEMLIERLQRAAGIAAP